MQDEPTKDEVVEEVVADEPQNLEPQVEEQQEEQVEEQVTEPAEQEEQVEEESSTEETPEEKPPSRREQLRVQALLQKYGDPRQNQPQQQAPLQRGEQLDYSQALDADPEVIQQLEADREAASSSAYQQAMQQIQTDGWKRDLKYETPAVMKDYPFLNPKDEEKFRPAAADAMNLKYLRFVGYDPGDRQKGIPASVQHPDLSYREFVESEMEFVEELASQKNAETVKNVTKQAAQTGLRPDGSSAPRMNLNKAPQDMSMEELYAAAGLGKPPKK